MTQPPRRGRRQPKTEAASAQLLRLAQSAGPGAQLPTFLELCHTLRVSKGTLDSALREMEQQKILERRHGVGIFVCNGVYKPLLLLMRDTYLDEKNGDPFWPLLIQHAHEWATRKNFKLEIHPVAAFDPATSISPDVKNLLQSKHWQGVLAFGLDVQISEWIVERGTLLVSFAGYAMNMVSLDSSYALRGGVWHLKELGCNRIGFWNYCGSGDIDQTGHEPTANYQFRQAVEGNEFAFDASLIRTFTDADSSHQSIESLGYSAAKEIYSSSHKPDGLVISHDHLTRGAIRAWEELNLQIGEDLKVVTAANRGSKLLSGYEDCLILMEFDALQIVQEMLELLEALRHGEIPGGAHRYVRPIVKSPVRKETLS